MKKEIFKPMFILLIFSAISFVPLKKEKINYNTSQSKVYIDSMMNMALKKSFFPGAQIIVGSIDSVFIMENYGYHDYSKKEKVTADDVYDLASMSKVLGTTLVTMRLVGDKKLKLKDKLGQIVELYKNTPIADITLFELLTHTSGLKSGIASYQSLLSIKNGSPLFSNQKSDEYPDLFDKMYVNKNIIYDPKYISFEAKDGYVRIYKNMWLNKEYYKSVYEKIIDANTKNRGKYLYSDLNMVLLQQIIEAKMGLSLDKLTNEIYAELGILKIGYNPLKWTSEKNIIPTEVDKVFRKDTIKGYVHDETAAIFGGVSGNAGLFSNAKSVAVICQMLLNDGNYKGKQILKSSIVREFIKSPLAKKQIYRGLGFDKRKPDEFYTKNDYGHTGFTGTYFFINPKNKIFLIVLSNRVNPSRTNRQMYDDDFCPKIWKKINEISKN